MFRAMSPSGILTIATNRGYLTGECEFPYSGSYHRVPCAELFIVFEETFNRWWNTTSQLLVGIATVDDSHHTGHETLVIWKFPSRAMGDPLTMKISPHTRNRDVMTRSRVSGFYHYPECRVMWN